MATDYSKMDNAELVKASKDLLDQDAAFYRESFVLVRELTARLEKLSSEASIPAGIKALVGYYDEVADCIPKPPMFKVGDTAHIDYEFDMAKKLEEAFGTNAVVKILGRKFHDNSWCYTVTDGKSQIENLYGIYLKPA